MAASCDALNTNCAMLRRVAKLEGLIVEWEDGYQRCDEAVDDMLVAEAARITKRRVK
jgi:hypothetical protein